MTHHLSHFAPLLQDRRKDMLASRIRQECWDVMQNHACDINALAIEVLKVKNLPVRKMSSGQQRKLDILKSLRITEIMKMKADGKNSTTWAGLTDEVRRRAATCPPHLLQQQLFY